MSSHPRYPRILLRTVEVSRLGAGCPSLFLKLLTVNISFYWNMYYPFHVFIVPEFGGLFSGLVQASGNVTIGAQVWVEDPELAWVEGEVLEINGKNVKVRSVKGNEVNTCSLLLGTRLVTMHLSGDERFILVSYVDFCNVVPWGLPPVHLLTEIAVAF